MKFRVTSKEQIEGIKEWLEEIYDDTVGNMSNLPNDVDKTEYLGVGELEIEIKYKHTM